LRPTRLRFWWQLLAMALLKPKLLYDYVTTLGVGEHFFSYRHQVRAQLENQLAQLKAAKAKLTEVALEDVPAPLVTVQTR
jgi:Domain of unknown function (DUF4070)